MTKEEISDAISYIKSYRKLDENLHNTAPKGSVSFYATEKCLHYWDMAIELLVHQSCEDTISKQAVLEIVERVPSKCDALFEIEKLPSIIPQPKTGHWIYYDGIKGWDNVEKCSCCNAQWYKAVLHDGDTKEFVKIRLPHCPTCGAEMKVEKEGMNESNSDNP